MERKHKHAVLFKAGPGTQAVRCPWCGKNSLLSVPPRGDRVLGLEHMERFSSEVTTINGADGKKMHYITHQCAHCRTVIENEELKLAVSGLCGVPHMTGAGKHEAKIWERTEGNKYSVVMSNTGYVAVFDGKRGLEMAKDIKRTWHPKDEEDTNVIGCMRVLHVRILQGVTVNRGRILSWIKYLIGGRSNVKGKGPKGRVFEVTYQDESPINRKLEDIVFRKYNVASGLAKVASNGELIAIQEKENQLAGLPALRRKISTERYASLAGIELSALVMRNKRFQRIACTSKDPREVVTRMILTKAKSLLKLIFAKGIGNVDLPYMYVIWKYTKDVNVMRSMLEEGIFDITKDVDIGMANSDGSLMMYTAFVTKLTQQGPRTMFKAIESIYGKSGLVALLKEIRVQMQEEFIGSGQGRYNSRYDMGRLHVVNAFDDTFNQFRRILEVKPDVTEWLSGIRPLTIATLHDHLSLQFAMIEDKELMIPFEYDQDETDLFVGTFGKLEFRLAGSPFDLKLWGQKMHNCVASYDEKSRKMGCYIVGAFEKDEMKYCIEIGRQVEREATNYGTQYSHYRPTTSTAGNNYDGTSTSASTLPYETIVEKRIFWIQQFLGPCNKRLDDSTDDATIRSIAEWLRNASEIAKNKRTAMRITMSANPLGRGYSTLDGVMLRIQEAIKELSFVQQRMEGVG